MTTRREVLALLAAPAFAAAPNPYLTTYKYGKLVLSAATEPGAFDCKTVDCPFVFRHGGRFYMTYVGWDGTGYQTGLASSVNLVDWHKEGCILKRDPASPITRYNIAMNWIVRENQLQAAGELRKVHGRFLGAFHAYPNAGLEQGPAVIGLCWSRDLLHWELGDVCLKPEDGADWEKGGLYKPCLLEYEGTYYLFYNAKTAGRSWREQTGVATSKDLKTWTRYPGNPILPNGGAGSWDERFASSFTAKPAPARSCWRAPSTTSARASRPPSSSSTAPPSPPACWKASSSATRRARSPAPSPSGSAASSWPTAAPSSWTKSARSPSSCNPSCCACCRSASSSASAVRAPFAPMPAWWRPPIATWGNWWSSASSAPISTTGSTSSP